MVVYLFFRYSPKNTHIFPLKTVGFLVECQETTQTNQLSNEKPTGYFLYIGDYTTHLYRDYMINHYQDPVLKQPGFNGKSEFIFSVAQLIWICYIPVW